MIWRHDSRYDEITPQKQDRNIRLNKIAYLQKITYNVGPNYDIY